MYKISLWRMLISQNVFFFFAKTVPNFLLLLFLLFFSGFLILVPFLLSTSFLLAGKVWTKSSVNPEKGTVDQFQVFCTKNGACFFRLALDLRIQSIYKMHSPLESSILAVSCLSEKLTDVQIDDVTSGSMTFTPNVDKSRLLHRKG